MPTLAAAAECMAFATCLEYTTPIIMGREGEPPEQSALRETCNAPSRVQRRTMSAIGLVAAVTANRTSDEEMVIGPREVHRR